MRDALSKAIRTFRDKMCSQLSIARRDGAFRALVAFYASQKGVTEQEQTMLDAFFVEWTHRKALEMQYRPEHKEDKAMREQA